MPYFQLSLSLLSLSLVSRVYKEEPNCIIVHNNSLLINKVLVFLLRVIVKFFNLCSSINCVMQEKITNFFFFFFWSK